MTQADLDRSGLDRPDTEPGHVDPGHTEPARPDPALLDQADRAAAAAASTAEVTVRSVDSLPELAAVARLFAEIWGRDTSPPLTIELLRAFAKAGNYVGGAFDGPTLLGACVGFFGSPGAPGPNSPALHSHIAGVSSKGAGRGVGFALKLHQRAWTLQHGVSTIAWTFDPLVRRNAYFNLVKLGAPPVGYRPDFYGPMTDRINGGDASDRLLVRWCLTDATVVQASEGRPPRTTAAVERAGGAVDVLAAAADGTPEVRRDAAFGDAPAALVAVPPDIEALRNRDPGAAAAWRTAVRDALTGLLAHGGRVSGFDPVGWYVVTRDQSVAPGAEA